MGKADNIISSIEQARTSVDEVAGALFAADPRIRSLGITKQNGEFALHAVRNSALALPLGTAVALPGNLGGLPIIFSDAPGEVESLIMVPGTPLSSHTSEAAPPETERRRPLVAGLQIQNFDEDERNGVILHRMMNVGTLGWFVVLEDGGIGLLTNNHVAAGSNRGIPGRDRIQQAGSDIFRDEDMIARLATFAELHPSPPDASPRDGNVLYNETDACTARLLEETPWIPGFLPIRDIPQVERTSEVEIGDQVLKVGRTTGLTRGEVIAVATMVGPVAYPTGFCWFRNSITVRGNGEQPFAAKGDSGAVLLNERGAILGLIYAGNELYAYACPIEGVLRDLNCRIV